MPTSKHRRKRKPRPRTTTRQGVQAPPLPPGTLDLTGFAEPGPGHHGRVIPAPIDSFGPHDDQARAFIARVATATSAEWIAAGDFGESSGTSAQIARFKGPRDRVDQVTRTNLPEVAWYLEDFDVEEAHFRWAPPRSEDAELAAAALAAIVAQDWIASEDYQTLTAAARSVGWLPSDTA